MVNLFGGDFFFKFSNQLNIRNKFRMSEFFGSTTSALRRCTRYESFSGSGGSHLKFFVSFNGRICLSRDPRPSVFRSRRVSGLLVAKHALVTQKATGP